MLSSSLSEVFSSSFVGRSRESRWGHPVSLHIPLVRPQRGQEAPRQDHLPPHGGQQPHTPELWRRWHHHPANPGREGRLAVRRVGEEPTVGFLTLMHHLCLFNLFTKGHLRISFTAILSLRESPNYLDGFNLFFQTFHFRQAFYSIQLLAAF